METKQTIEDFLKEKHKKYQNELGLNLWRHEIRISGTPRPKTDCLSDNVAAEIQQQTSYLSYVITFYPTFVEMYDRGEYEECEMVLVHEMCHVLTEPIFDIAVEHCPPAENRALFRERERLTEILSKFVYFAREK